LPGHYCQVGTPYPVPCENGTYQGASGQDSCLECPRGFYCDPAEGPVVSPKQCPSGFYCLDGTSYKKSYPCKAGTFGPDPGYANETQCQQCTEGFYCGTDGLSNVTGLCYAGHYCMKGAKGPSPFEDRAITGWKFDFLNDLCPKGYFCMNGTSEPSACPRGRYSEESGLKREVDCQECPPGKYCDVIGAKELKDPPNCAAGYVCLGGSYTATPTDGTIGYKCPKGFYCPAGMSYHDKNNSLFHCLFNVSITIMEAFSIVNTTQNII